MRDPICARYECGRFTGKFSLIAESFEGLPIDRAIFDGEICVVADGRTDFSALQAALKSGRQAAMVYYIFDLLFLDSFDLRRSPQIDRKRILKSLYDEAGMAAPILYSEHMTEDGQAMFEAAGRLNWEGIVSKRVDAPYRSDRNEGWLEIKTAQRARFPIVGFVPGAGGIAALYLGRRNGRQLIYAGNQGRHRLYARRQRRSPPEARRAGDAKIKTDEAGQQAKGDVG